MIIAFLVLAIYLALSLCFDFRIARHDCIQGIADKVKIEFVPRQKLIMLAQQT